MSHAATRWAAVAAVCGVLLAACAGGEARRDEAAPAAEVPERVVLLVRTPRHLRVALATSRELLAGAHAGLRADEAHVVACGDAVPALVVDSPTAEAVRVAASEGVAVKACGLTVRKKGLDPGTFVPAVRVVPNGLVEVLRLQAEGFRSVEL